MPIVLVCLIYAAVRRRKRVVLDVTKSAIEVPRRAGHWFGACGLIIVLLPMGAPAQGLSAERNREAAKASSERRFYYHSDHLGSTNVLSDGRGREIERLEYEPFGEQYLRPNRSSNAPTADFSFNGQQYDDASGLYDFKSRHYDPVIGRFISPDTVIPEAENPAALHRYAFNENNPIRYIDPTGRGVFDVILGVLIAIALVAAAVVVAVFAAPIAALGVLGTIIIGAVVGAAIGAASFAVAAGYMLATGMISSGSFLRAVIAGAVMGLLVGALIGAAVAIPAASPAGVILQHTLSWALVIGTITGFIYHQRERTIESMFRGFLIGFAIGAVIGVLSGISTVLGLGPLRFAAGVWLSLDPTVVFIVLLTALVASAIQWVVVYGYAIWLIVKEIVTRLPGPTIPPFVKESGLPLWSFRGTLTGIAHAPPRRDAFTTLPAVR